MIDLNKALVDLDGKAIPDTTQGKVLALQLANSPTRDGITATKHWDWARRLNKSEPLELDRADLRALTEFVETSPQLSALSKSQLLDTIRECQKTHSVQP